MIRALNNHSAAIDDVPRDAIGLFDENNPGIRALLDAGHLVRIGDEPSASQNPSFDRPPTLDETREMVAEIDRRGAHIATLTAERDALLAEVAELRAAAVKKPRAKSEADKSAEG